MTTDISVIIPVYGVSRFIERCATSLMCQTLKDGVEFIFIDDASKDESRRILEEVISRFPERKDQVRIITHPVNKGLPGARNTGMEAAKGKYIYHFDGDDFTDAALLEGMLNKARETDADYIWADWYLSYEETERLMPQPDASTSEMALKLMMQGRMKYNVWNKLVKRSLYEENNIKFPEGFSMGEDMTMIKILVCANSVAHADGAWYHYVKTNNDAMTSSPSPKALSEIYHNAESTIAFLADKGIKPENDLVGKFKLSIKYPLLFTGQKSDFKRWRTWWPESNAYITKENGLHSLLVQLMARYNAWPLLWMHYNVYNFVYRSLYK